MNANTSQIESDWQQRHQYFETLRAQGQQDEAKKDYKNLMDTAPDRYDLWVNYASFLYNCGQYHEAIAMAEKSIQIQPSAEGYHNLGTSLKDSGRYEEAIEAYKNALKINYDLVQSHNDIAACYQITRQIHYAIDHYQIACGLKPDTLLYWTNLAKARTQASRPREALSALRQARRLHGGAQDEQNDKIWTIYANCFWNSDDFDISGQLLDEVTICMYHPLTRSDKMTKVVQKLFYHQPVIKYLKEIVENQRIEDFENLIVNPALNWPVLAHPVFCGWLEKILIRDLKIEDILTALRAHFLNICVDDDLEKTLWDEHGLSFVSAIANQCFLNEYVYNITAEEQSQLQKLEKKITSQDTPSLYDIAILACYKPLHQLSYAVDLVALKNDKTASLFRIQYEEPMEEARIKEGIETITTIDDKVSQLVKQQYEENPYPRWTDNNTFERAPFQEVMTQIFPYLTADSFKAIDPNQPMRTLIAGCGTGKQVMESESLFGNQDILAVDLSASSLSYAIRKAREKNINNVRFGLADILKLGELGQQFDIIQSTGVLHHMHDPMAGWKVLTGCLKPGGFMLIALYSETARKSIVAARNFVKKQGFESTAEGIRECRNQMRKLPDNHPVKPALAFADFSSLSEVKDLIFHVQEHRFTVPMLKKSLKKLNLKFISFHFPNISIMNHYVSQYPDDPHGLNLDNWHKYEQDNPQTFTGMYQFWCQK